MNVLKHIFKEKITRRYVTLLKVSVHDAEDIYRWRTSKSGEFLHQPLNYSVESQRKWITSRTGEEINYIIYRNDLMEKVGMVSIYEVNYEDMVTNVGRLILDEKYIHNKTPYGLESLLITYDYAFNTMGFRKITGVILGSNVKVYELQKYLGMTQEGYLKAHVMISDHFEDLYIMSLFSDEFTGYSEKLKALLR